MIDKSSIIGQDVEIGNNIFIGKNCKIGNGVIIHNNVTIYDNTIIKENTEIFDNAVLGRPPKTAANLIHKIKKEYKGLTIGKECVVGCGVVLYSGTKIGNNVLLGDCASIREECLIENNVLIARHVTINHSTRIDNDCKIMDLTHITSKMIIEENVFISTGVTSTNDNKMRIKGEPVGKSAGPHIKRNARIGAGASLLPGVVVGENSVVGACALVTKDVPNSTLVMGIPARIIKKSDK